MNKKIIITIVILLVAIGSLFLLGMTKDRIKDVGTISEIEKSREIAKNWIINTSPTYVTDGFDLKLLSEEELEEAYLFIFSFKSRAAGYGYREGGASAQVITPHTIEVTVQEGEIVKAITDRIFYELESVAREEDEYNDEEIMEPRVIDLYFVKVINGQEEIVKVEREVITGISIGRTAIEELLFGLYPHEEDEGLSTAINKGTILQDIHIKNGVAFVDFNEKLEEGVAGSAWVMAIRNQIEKTLLQFDTVDEVVISINGRTDDILQP